MERYSPPEVTKPGGSYFAAPKTGIEFISSGSKLLDLALGGGWAERRIGNVVGDKSSGKTLLMIEAAANFAIKYPKSKIRYRESEAAFDEPYAEALGMPLDQVDFGEPLDTVEDMFEDLEKIIRDHKGPELYILDSLDSLTDRAELERDMNEGTYGTGKAKQMSQLLRRLTRKMSGANVTMLIVSQVRDNIGVTFGKKVTRSGGRALDFYASQVVMLAQAGKISQSVKGIERPVGVKVKAMVEKNKVSLPFREAEFDIRFGFGVDDLTACLNWLKIADSLDEVEVPASDIKKFVRNLNKVSDDEYWKFVRRVRKVVERRWYEVEQSFLPTRQKYR